MLATTLETVDAILPVVPDSHPLDAELKQFKAGLNGGGTEDDFAQLSFLVQKHLPRDKAERDPWMNKLRNEWNRLHQPELVDPDDD